MKNVKFWLAQIAMVAIISLVFGSPVFAEGHGFDDEKWHEQHQKMFDKKIAMHPEKLDHWQAQHDQQLAEHNAEHHADEPDPDPDPDPTCADLGLLGTWPHCF